MLTVISMEAMSFTSNVSNIKNYTVYFDYYCRELPEGPLGLAVCCVLCTLVGLPASVWLLWVLGQKGRSGLTKDLYMLNLTIMDLIFNTFSIPGMFNYFVWRSKYCTVLFDVLYCFNLCGRPLLIACICVDCYMAVVHPISYIKLKHGRYRVVACTMVWTLTLIYGLLIAFELVLNFTLLVIPYAVSLPTIAFCDSVILHALRKPDASGGTDIHPQKQRALQTITNSFIMTVVAYLPPLVIYGFSSLIPLPPQEMWCDVSVPLLISPLLGSAIMPLLYLQNLGCLKEISCCQLAQ